MYAGYGNFHSEATMPLTIRHAGPGDAPVVAEYNRLLAEETEGKILIPEVLAAGVRTVLADPTRGRYFLAERDGAVVGQIMITFEWSDWRNGWIWWIQSVYIRHQDRRQGVFRSLYEHVARLAREDPGVVGLRLYVMHDNHAAQKTYEALGMIPTSYFVLERCPLE
jgi:ribosomal protein S18 acetylase RimI-like enzyme